MRKVLLILALSIISCTPDKEAPDVKDCMCGEVVESAMFKITPTQTVYYITIKNDCTNVMTEQKPSYFIPIGTKLCNY
jgi:hypothetical protein